MPLCLPAGKSNNPDVGGPWWLAGEDAERWSSYTTERANATSRHPETPYWLHLPPEKPTDRSHRCMYSVFQKTFWNIFTLVKFFCLKFCKFVGNSYRRLRSGSTSTLLVPSTRRATLGDRAFPVAAARAWNALPSSVRTSSTYLAFRRQLKTLLFKASFEDRTWLRYLFVAQR